MNPTQAFGVLNEHLQRRRVAVRKRAHEDFVRKEERTFEMRQVFCQKQKKEIMMNIFHLKNHMRTYKLIYLIVLIIIIIILCSIISYIDVECFFYDRYQ